MSDSPQTNTEDRFDFKNTPATTRPGLWPYLSEGVDACPPVVSIVTPFYNPGLVFAETALSVCRQSWQAWEWIIVDDGSTDVPSLGQLAAAVEKDPRIRTIRLDRNQGISVARNRGLTEGKGRYVCWLDADDLLEPTFLEKCIWRLESSPHLAFTKGFTVGFGASQYLWRHGFHDRERFLRENRIDPTSLVRIEVAREIGGFDESISAGLEDWDFWLRAASKGYWGDTISEPLNWYRRRTAHVARWDNLRSDAKREHFEQLFRERYPSLWSGHFPQPRAVDCEGYSSSFVARPVKKDKRRALFIVPHLELGGADRFNLDLIAQLTRRFDWEITVVTTRCSLDPWQDKFYELTSDVFMLHRFLPFGAYPSFLSYIIESRQPDVVYLSHSELGYRLLPWLKEAFPALPVIDLVHIVEDDWKDGGFPRFSARARPGLTRTVAISETLKRWLVENGRDSATIDVVHCDIDTAHWTRTAELTEAARLRWNIPVDRPVILYAARFSAQKNPQALPEILRLLGAQHVDFVLVLAGDGPQRLWVEEHVCRAFPRSVHWVGTVEPGEMRLLMSIADLLVLPSRAEGIALVLYEAMSMGVVPVATDVGGQRELVTPECGVLLPADSNIAESCARELTALLRDPVRRSQMAHAGRRRVEELFDLKRMGNQMDTIFRSVARTTNSPLKAQAEAPGDLVSRVAGDLVELETGDLALDAWDRKIREGKWLLRVVSQSASWLRRSPARRWFRRFEIRYGDRLGKWLMRRA